MARAVAFTGYRPEKFDFGFSPEEPRYVELEDRLINTVLSLHEEGYSRFYCGAAMGFDLLCGEIVILLKKRFADMRLCCFVPFRGQQRDFPDGWKKRYEDVLAASDEVVMVSQQYERGCYSKRNRKMVDGAEVLVTYFDGVKGGTAQTMAYAKKKNLRIINLYDMEEEGAQYKIFNVFNPLR